MKFIVDGNNVCYWKEDKSFSFSFLLELLIQLKKRDDTFICFFDANIERILNEINVGQEKVKNLLKDNIKYFKTVPAGNRADDYILVTAHRYGASIITNDRFESEKGKDYASKMNWISDKNSVKRLYKGQVMFFGEEFGNEWVLMVPDLGIEVPVVEDINKKIDELLVCFAENETKQTMLSNNSLEESTDVAEGKVPNEEETEKKPRHKGEIFVISEDKGFGFIVSDDFSENIYFKLGEIRNPKILKVGEKVTFETSQNLKGLVAISIWDINDDYTNTPRKKKNIQYLAEIANLKDEGEFISPSVKVLGKVDLNKFSSRKKQETQPLKEEKLPEPIISNPRGVKVVGKIDLSNTGKKSFSDKKDTNILGEVADEFETTVVDLSNFLRSKGFKVTPHPQSRIDNRLYTIIKQEFPNRQSKPFSKRSGQESYSVEELKDWWNSLPVEWHNIFGDILRFDIPEQRDLLRIINLTYLDCKTRDIDTLEPLRKLQKIKVLICDNTNIEDLSPLSELLSLEKLNLSGNKIKDLSPLQKLQNLKYLYCDNTLIDSMETFRHHRKLKVLDCGNTGVEDIDPCRDMISLKELWIHHTNVKDLSPLAEKQDLQELWCYESKVDSLKALDKLTTLKILDCSNTKVENSESLNFKEQNPECEVYF